MSGIATAIVGGAVVGGVASNMAAKKGAKATSDAANSSNQLEYEMYQQQRDDQAPWRNVGVNALNELAMRLGIGGSGSGLSGYNTAYPLAGAKLVDTTSGVPRPNSDLYRTSPEYKAAWDAAMAKHQAAFGGGYTYDSDPTWIESEINNSIGGLINQQTAGAQGQTQGNPLYGSLLKSFSESDFKTDPGYEFRLGEGQKALESSAAARGGLLSGAAAKALTKYNQNFASNEYQNVYNRFTNDQNNTYNRLAGIAGVGQTATNQLGQASANLANNVGNTTTWAGTQRASGYANTANSIASGIGSATNGLVNYMRPSYGSYGYSATSYPVTDYYSGVSGTPI